MNDKSNNYYQELAHKYIPGGAHTYSRGDDQFPSNAPAVLTRGKGAYVWDAEDNKFLDYGMGLRSVCIGYDNELITNAAYEEIKKGNNLTRASITEIKAAERMCELIPSMEMVKFAKHGSTVTSAAVKLARAVTQKKIIVRCIEQPFLSFDDWFIGNTVINSGIPEEIQNLTKNFVYNNIESLEFLFDNFKDQISCVIMEAATTVIPKKSKYFPNEDKNFLHDVQTLCKKNDSLFIIDEMITGFRWAHKGAASLYNIDPDLITFGKAMANGFSVAALGGKRKYMERGGINHTQERVFLTSTTHGAEMCGMGAFLATMEFYDQNKVTDHMWKFGKDLIEAANKLAQEHGVSHSLKFEGFPCSPTYSTLDKNNEVSLGLRTLLNQEMIKNKVIFNYLAISYSHQENELSKTLEALDSSLKTYSKALSEGYEKYLVGNVIKPVFRKFN